MTAIQLSTAYRPVNCCRCGCGFALPDGFVRARREDHKTFFCPNGHANHFPQQTEEERLRADLEWAERRAANAAKRADNIAEQRDAERRRSAALKGVVTRTKNRIDYAGKE